MDDVEKIAIELRGLIGRARTISDNTDFNEAFTTAENIIGTLAYFISPLVQVEQKYRTKVVEFMAEGDSAAKAEARAKASPEYFEWKKYQMLYDLGGEQVMLLKKFQTKLSDEFTRS